jgi:hypothetical protein
MDIYNVLSLTENKKLEYGLGLAYTLGPSLEIHGEIMLHQQAYGYDHYVFDFLTADTTFSFYPTRTLPERLYTEWIIGFNGTWFNINFIGEYYHKDWGITTKEWDMLTRFHQHNFGRIHSHPAALMNCYSALSMLGSKGAFKDYFFLRIAKRYRNFDVSSISLTNLSDWSTLFILELTYQLTDTLKVFVEPMFFTGNFGTEYKEMFYSHDLQFGMSLYF